jgi:hypothetical protein
VIAPRTITARNPAAEAAYEQMRQSVSNSTCAGHLGLAVLMREGITAWMAHDATRATTGAQRTQEARDSKPAGAPIALDDFHAGLVRVLATMALAQERKTA